MISLRSQVNTSQAVQRDFVELSQSLQVKTTVSGQLNLPRSVGDEGRETRQKNHTVEENQR